MPKDSSSPDSNLETSLKGHDHGGGFSLLVSCASGVAIVPLGGAASHVLGRTSDCDVAVDDASVSRKHAVLRLGGDMTIEDLGSRNGTTVQQLPIEAHRPMRIAVGSVFELGDATFVLQRGPDLSRIVDEPRGVASRASPAPSAHAATIVADATMKRLYAMLDVVAPTSLSVLVLGETGVGKEVFAQAVHARSKRAGGPFVQLNCAALAESLLEGELFGYEKGAFTGAVQAKAGLFEAADGGTVFLDELGELPITTQAKLLRVLESGHVTRLGSVKSKIVDVRFVAATNRDLRKLIADGAFRSDLYFRINGISITLPPLRKRRADIAPLAQRFVERATAKVKRAPASLTPAAVARLEEHDWPGNVRELRNVIERTVVLSPGAELDAQHLLFADDMFGEASDFDAPEAPIVQVPPNATPQLRDQIESLYRKRVLDAIERTHGNQSQAAKMLGVSRRTLVTRMEQYGLERPRKGKK